MMIGVLPYIIVPFAIGVVAFIVWLSYASERGFRRQLNLRDPMDDVTFYESFYASADVPADIPQRLRPIYAKFFGIDVTKLRPTDRPPLFVPKHR